MTALQTRRTRTAVWFFALSFAALMPGRSGAEEGLATDRPDFTETTETVRPGFIQAEAGLTLARETDIDATNLPELLLRIGLVKGIELRIGAPDANWTTSVGNTEFTRGDASLGFKVELVPEDFPMGIAAIPVIHLAIQDSGDNQPVPEFILAWSRDLPRGWSLGGIVGHSWVEGARAGETNVLFPTVSITAPLSESIGSFLEWSAEFVDGAQGSHLLHHGYTLALNRDFQVDVHAAVGLTDTAPDFFMGAGLALQRGMFD